MSEALVKVMIPDGWELACDEIRYPRQGEHYLLGINEVLLRCNEIPSIQIPRVIVRRKWAWPAWLKAEWLWQGHWGLWVASSERPCFSGNFWYTSGIFQEINPETLDFTPPPCDDWRLSLRRNPAFEQMED